MRALIFVTQFYQLSGSETLAVDLAHQLASRGHEVEILSLYRRSLPGVHQAERKLNSLGIKSVSYLGLPVNPGIRQILLGIVKVRKRLKQQRYDFIETSFMGPMTILCWASMNLPVQVIGGIHAVYERSIHRSLKHRLWRYSVKYNSRIKFYGISEAVTQAWCAYAAISSNRIRQINNAIREEFFGTSPDSMAVKLELQIPQQRRLVLFVGSLLKYKGIDTLVEAIGPLLKRLNLHLLLVGERGKNDAFMPGEPDFFHNIENRIQEKGWNERVRLLGHREDIARLMASCDLLVHPARSEGFGLVLAEALASGLPIVATDVGGIPEVLAQTDSIQVPVGNSAQLQHAIQTMLSLSAEEREGRVARGKLRAEKFRMKRRIDELLAYADQCA